MAAASFLSSPPPVHLLLLLMLFINIVSSELPPTKGPDFSCSADSPPSCQTYVTYMSQQKNYNDLATIADLFGVSRSSVAKANNQISEDSQLVPGQPLLIPVNCGCTGNKYFANMTYQMQRGDTYFSVTSNSFENLTNVNLVNDMNPGLNPTELIPGSEIVLPLFCKCPSKTFFDDGIKFLITYMWQPIDDVLNVSSNFNTSVLGILSENNYQNLTTEVGSPVLIPVSQLPQLPLLPQRPSSKARKLKDQHIHIAIGSSIGAFVVVPLAVLVFCTCRLLKKRRKVPYLKGTNYDLEINQDKLLSGISQYLGKPIAYESEMIMEATMNFDELCRIGGSMYRGTMYGKVLAVKRTEVDIKEELNILQKVNHVNLVSLLGISNEKDGVRFLVYEFAENGSLDKWLYLNSSVTSSSSNGVTCLTWRQRIQIALDVANGLHYMHDHTQPNIVHCDVRSKNILLDSQLKAKIANFEMARTVADPVMLKVDVFAFGILLFELLSGKKALETKQDSEIVMSCKEVREVLRIEEKRVDRLIQWMDPKLDNCYPIDGALSLAALAWTCTEEKATVRPKMADIVFNLSLLAQSLPKTMHRPSISEFESESIVEVVIPVQGR